MATIATRNQEWTYWLKICYPTLDVRPVSRDGVRPSKMIVNSRGKASYRWALTEMEKKHITKLLDIDGLFISPLHPSLSPQILFLFNLKQNLLIFHSFTVKALNIRGTTMNRERQICKVCGKASGLDDIVQDSLDSNTHTREYIIRALQMGPKKETAAQYDIYCSSCGEKHVHKAGWTVYEESWLF